MKRLRKRPGDNYFSRFRSPCSISRQKDGSEPFPTELKSVLIPPKYPPLLRDHIRGGFFCIESAEDAFLIRLGFDFARTRSRTAPNGHQADRSRDPQPVPAEPLADQTEIPPRSPPARSLGTGQALSAARSTEAWPTTTGAAWPISGASLVGQAARTPQETGPSARG